MIIHGLSHLLQESYCWRYKPESRLFDPQWAHWIFPLT
jgi:hypothetical protein